jgi:hypothetical protein
LGPILSLMISLDPGPPCPVLASCHRPSRCDRQGPINKSPSESDTGPSSKEKVSSKVDETERINTPLTFIYE